MNIRKYAVLKNDAPVRDDSSIYNLKFADYEESHEIIRKKKSSNKKKSKQKIDIFDTPAQKIDIFDSPPPLVTTSKRKQLINSIYKNNI